MAREAAGRQAGKRGAGKSATRESGGKRGRKGVYADIRVSPVTAILRKTFDLFAHAVANPEERLIPTRMLGMPRFPPSPPLSLSLSLSLSPCPSSFYTARRIRPRPRTFRYSDGSRAFLRLRELAKIQPRSRSTANYS